jgi:hypothetical protein
MISNKLSPHSHHLAHLHLALIGAFLCDAFAMGVTPLRLRQIHIDMDLDIPPPRHATRLDRDAIGLALRDLATRELANDLATPLAHDLATSLAHDLATPLAHDLATPLAHDLATPLANDLAAKVTATAAAAAGALLQHQPDMMGVQLEFVFTQRENPE